MDRPLPARRLPYSRQLSGAATTVSGRDSLAPRTAALCATINAEDVNGQSSYEGVHRRQGAHVISWWSHRREDACVCDR